jgi:hypothetical protein
MDEDKNVMYFYTDADTDDGMGNFYAISSDQNYYLNENGEVVIVFSQAGVALAYYGCVEFTIPKTVVSGIFK